MNFTVTKFRFTILLVANTTQKVRKCYAEQDQVLIVEKCSVSVDDHPVHFADIT